MNKIQITQEVINQIQKTIGTYPIETGGIIGGSDTCITHFCFDDHNSENSYVPNVSFLNEAIKKWANENVEFLGIIHSHPSFSTGPSLEDLKYAVNLKRKNPFLNRLFFPIVIDNKIVFYELLNDKFVKIDFEVI